MTTLEIAEPPNGSLADKWIKVGSKPDVSAVVLWDERNRQEGLISADGIPYYLSYGPREGFSENADVGVLPGAEMEFKRLTAEWKQETAHLSAPNMIAEHRAYQEIIGMGKDAIPLILQDLKQTKAQWFWALRSIARESPIEPDDRGDVDAMTVAWLHWGRKHRYIDSVS